MFVVVECSGEYEHATSILLGVYDSFENVKLEFGEFQLIMSDSEEREYIQELSNNPPSPGSRRNEPNDAYRMCYEMPSNKRCRRIHILNP